MSMVINLVEDHNIYLCEGGPVYNGGVQPTPITYLTQWKIVGNSEVHDNEIWSCGEYNPTDGKYHILVQPLGGSIADIALTKPLRMTNDVADTIEFPSSIEGKALVTRNLSSILIGNNRNTVLIATNKTDVMRMGIYDVTAKSVTNNSNIANILCSVFEAKSANATYTRQKGIAVDKNCRIQIYDPNYNTASDINNFKNAYANTEIIYELVTPTTELVDAPQIAEA
jgi:hypothetical protein